MIAKFGPRPCMHSLPWLLSLFLSLIWLPLLTFSRFYLSTGPRWYNCCWPLTQTWSNQSLTSLEHISEEHHESRTMRNFDQIKCINWKFVAIEIKFLQINANLLVAMLLFYFLENHYKYFENYWTESSFINLLFIRKWQAIFIDGAFLNAIFKRLFNRLRLQLLYIYHEKKWRSMWGWTVVRCFTQPGRWNIMT